MKQAEQFIRFKKLYDEVTKSQFNSAERTGADKLKESEPAKETVNIKEDIKKLYDEHI